MQGAISLCSDHSIEQGILSRVLNSTRTGPSSAPAAAPLKLSKQASLTTVFPTLLACKQVQTPTIPTALSTEVRANSIRDFFTPRAVNTPSQGPLNVTGNSPNMDRRFTICRPSTQRNDRRQPVPRGHQRTDGKLQERIRRGPERNKRLDRPPRTSPITATSIQDAIHRAQKQARRSTFGTTSSPHPLRVMLHDIVAECSKGFVGNWIRTLERANADSANEDPNAANKDSRNKDSWSRSGDDYGPRFRCDGG